MNIYHEAGLYIVSDDYFDRFPDTHWSDNKNESRPYYYVLRDKEGMLWMIPITSKVENIKEKIRKEEQRRGRGKCIYYHIGMIAGKERGFKIGNMFPVTEEYILHNYTINGIPYFVGDKTLISEINTKARKFLSLVESHSIHTAIDILKIKSELLKDIIK